MKDYDYFLFDLDGTLTDSAPGIINSVIYSLKKLNIEETDRIFLRRFIGPPLIESFMQYYGFDREKAVLAVKYYREYFSDIGIFENSVYDGIRETLEKLKENGKKVILATSKPQEFAERILEHFDLTRYFDIVAGATMDERRTKKSEVIAYVIQLIMTQNAGLSRSELADKMVMVGDREQDVCGAAANDIDCIGVLYGFGDRPELEKAGASFIIGRPEELLGFFKEERDRI